MKYTNFKLKLRAFLAVFVMLFFCVSVNAQKLSLTGVVRDAVSGEPILGANILEKGTTNGTITNFDGEFSLTLSPNATLVVKYVGYQPQEIQVAGQKNLIIKLQEDAVVLGEVVAIGYATVKKNDATGSITAIKPDKLNKGLTTNAQDMITGKIAGVNVTSDGGTPGGSSKIRIRGGSSLSASNDPLIVVDGLTLDNNGIKGVANGLSTINPNDIESFTVLKDASATAIYGSRASNGVIIITTKRGEKGSKPRVSYDGNMSVSKIRETLDVLTGDEFRSLANSTFGDDVPYELGTANTDWQKEIYQAAIGHDQNFNITGGLKNMPYRVSFGYTNQDGIIKTSNFERYTGAINVNPSFFDDHLKVSINAKGMYVKSRFADTGVVGAAAAMDPTRPVTTTEEPLASKLGGYWQWYDVNGDGTYKGYNTNAVKNPLATLNQKDDVAKATDFIGNIEFDYKMHFLPELRAHLTLGYNEANGKQDTYQPVNSTNNNGYGYTGWEEKYKYNKSLTFFMNYAKEFGLHNVDVMGGYEYQHFYTSGSSESMGLLRTDTNKDGTVDTNDDFYNKTSKEWKTENLLVSFFGRLNYTIANKYLFTATLRNDGSSRFAKNNRWGLFPSAAFAWKITEESFMKEKDTFSDLKLRLGYGTTGQQDLSQGDYPYLPVYVQNKDGAYYPLGTVYYSTYKPGAYNADLKWEETTTYNAGIDWGILNNRLTGAVDVYYRKTNDLLNMTDVSAGTNFDIQVIKNIGSLENKGVEFTIQGKPIVKKDFSWDISYNVTYNQNRITKLTSGTGENYRVTTGGISGTGGTIQAHAVGFPASSFYVFEQVYDNGGKPIEGLFVDRNGDGIINDDDKYYFHNPSPDITMGLSSKLIYKNFDLGITLRSSIGNYVYNNIESQSAQIGSAGWSSLGFYSNIPTSALYTNFTGNKDSYHISDYYVQNASFVRIDNITAGYTFNNLFNVIKSGRIYATVQNPLIITKYRGLDPEVFGGIDRDLYPRPIVTLVGLSLNF